MMFFLRVYFHPITTPVVVENTSKRLLESTAPSSGSFSGISMLIRPHLVGCRIRLPTGTLVHMYYCQRLERLPIVRVAQ